MVGSAPRWASLETESFPPAEESAETLAGKRVKAKRPGSRFRGPGVNWMGCQVRRKRKGSPTRARTSDKAVNSRLLYQLSYRGWLNSILLCRLDYGKAADSAGPGSGRTGPKDCAAPRNGRLAVEGLRAVYGGCRRGQPRICRQRSIFHFAFSSGLILLKSGSSAGRRAGRGERIVAWGRGLVPP